MKAILTLIAIIFFSTTGVAQKTSNAVKVATITKSIVLDLKVKNNFKQDNKVARLYMFKNSRIKKALAFKTKRNGSKLA